jgi:hypothetical protein
MTKYVTRNIHIVLIHVYHIIYDDLLHGGNHVEHCDDAFTTNLWTSSTSLMAYIPDKLP